MGGVLLLISSAVGITSSSFGDELLVRNCGLTGWVHCYVSIYVNSPCLPDRNSAIYTSRAGPHTDLLRPSFNLTIFWTAIFFIASAGANNFISFCTLQALVGFGTGGNAAIDILLFLECLPASQQWLIALLYTWWSTGQLIASLVSWVYLAHYSCPTDFIAGECRRQQNMGW